MNEKTKFTIKILSEFKTKNNPILYDVFIKKFYDKTSFNFEILFKELKEKNYIEFYDLTLHDWSKIEYGIEFNITQKGINYLNILKRENNLLIKNFKWIFDKILSISRPLILMIIGYLLHKI